MIDRIKDSIFAHRGYHSKPEIPENSLAAFRRAIERKWGAELDVHLLSDGTLAVIHDSSLKRCTGAEGIIEALDYEKMKKLRLEGTDECIPTFDEVLELFENSDNGKGRTCPLIIELKPVNKNHKSLVKAVCDRLDSYKGDFCIESFDPHVLVELKKYRPKIIRGQLAENFLGQKTSMPYYRAYARTNLLWDVVTKPDFVAYKFADRSNKALRREIDKKGLIEVAWTLRNRQDFDKAVSAGCIPIFERFDPEEKEPEIID